MKSSGLQTVNQAHLYLLHQPLTSLTPLIFFDDSVDLSNGYESMLDMENVTDSSEDEEDNIPSLRSFSDSSEDEDDLYGDYKVPEMFKKSANVQKGYDSMLELVPDYDNLEDNDLEAGDFFGEFLDGEGDRLVKDFGGDAFTRTFMCAMLANTGRFTKGVETELYNSGASCHMTVYHD